MSFKLDGYSDGLQFISPNNDPNSPARTQFQCDAWADAMANAFLTNISPVMRYFTTSSADCSAQLILYQCPRPEGFYRSMSLSSTSLRPLDVFSPLPCFQQLPRVYSAPNTGSSVEQLLSSSPSPLPKVPTAPRCDISPPIHATEGTPFDRHFDLSHSWNSSSPGVSPIARRTSDSNVTPSREGGNSCYRFSGGPYFETPWLLMDKLPSLNPSKHCAFSPDRTSSSLMHASGPSYSPVSSLSSLTTLSSPERSISDDVPDGWSPAHPIRSPIPARNTTTDRYSKDSDELGSPSPGSLHTARHLVSARSCKHLLPEDCDEELPSGRTKRARTVGPNVGLPSQPLETYSGIPSKRRLPPDVSCHPGFPLFYRRYPISSFLEIDDEEHPGGIYNSPRDSRDLYTPRFVKGKGRTKVGLCPICIESPSRGGRGQKIWLSMKFSAFKCYHMQFAHGVSAMTGRPFSPPVSYRTTRRRHPLKIERSEIIEGMCHVCKQWVAIESIKDCEVKVKELFWWKHAATCHQGSQIPGDDDFYEQDDVFSRLEDLSL